MEIKIAIIEDEVVHTKLLSGYLNEWSREQDTLIQIKEFVSAESFLFEWEDNNDFDMLFVDIQMKAMNGMEMAKKIRRKDTDINIVFTTGITDYLQEGYEVEAMHYLIKPIDEVKVKNCMDKVVAKIARESSNLIKYLLVHSRDELLKVPQDRINYIEARGHHVIMEVMTDKQRTEHIEITESLSEIAKNLDTIKFVKCHRSYICNLQNVHHIDKENVALDSGSKIPVSRRLYAEVNQAFIKFFV